METPAIQGAVEGYLRENFSPEQVTGLIRRHGRRRDQSETLFTGHAYSDDDYGGTLCLYLLPTPKEATTSGRTPRSPRN